MTRWHLWLDDTARPGWQNMAIDTALLDLAGEGRAVLRLYRWEPFCLSFGRHEPAARRYGRDRVTALGIDVVRRPTGGRAVWHARELTYAVAAPAGLGSLREMYRSVHSMLADAVRRLGAPAVLAAMPARLPRPGDGPCFAVPVGGEVTVKGRKVVGSAQVRRGEAFLQHGSMLLEDSQELVHRLAGAPAGPSADAPLSLLTGRAVSFDEAAAAVLDAARRWSPGAAPLEDPALVLERARNHETGYRSETWTWER